MIRPPLEMGSFEFVVIASLRVAQLVRGCTPRVTGTHQRSTTALLEVSEGRVTALANAIPVADPAA